MCRPIRSRCATCPAPATRWPRCWRCMLATRRRLRVRDARRQCGGRRRRRQARHRDGLARRAARTHPAGGLARARGEDRVRLVACSTSGSPNGGAQGLRIGFTNGCFDLLHPRPRQAAGGGARRLRPPGRRPQQRRLGRAAQGQGPADPDPAQARAEVLAALEAVDLVVVFERGHAAGTDQARAADRAGQGRRLQARRGGRPRGGRGRGRRGGPGRPGARSFDHQHGAPRRPDAGHRAAGKPAAS